MCCVPGQGLVAGDAAGVEVEIYHIIRILLHYIILYHIVMTYRVPGEGLVAGDAAGVEVAAADGEGAAPGDGEHHHRAARQRADAHRHHI